jgi:tetratricopeptide (TPR) repeat protein
MPLVETGPGAVMSKTPKLFIPLYTPSRADPKDLEEIFVQREKLAEVSLARLRASAQSPDADKYHLLFIGPRGSGKTHLVAILVHRLESDPSLADRLRIAWLAEDESSPAFFKFLLRICRALHGQYPAEFPDPPMSDLHALPDDNRRGERLIQFLLEHLDGHTLLVVVENLDEVFRGLETEGQQQWRAFLQEHPITTTLATSQQLTEEMSDRDEPFFGFFQTEYLKPLSLADATELLRKIAAANSKDDLKAFLETSTGRSRVRAIRHLSGGSHRVYIALSEFLTRESLDDLVAAFNQLLDELTPYYQERLRWLPKQQREIVEYLCKCRQTTPVKDIARDLFIAETSVSSQLKQLRDRGYVISNTVGREARYELAEPLMRLCIEVKENRREPIRLIVEFLRVWYDKDQCEDWLVRIPPDAGTERKYLEAVLREFTDNKKDPRAELLLKEFAALSSEDRREQLEDFSRDFEAVGPTAVQWLQYAQILLGDRLDEKALSSLDRVVTLVPNAPYVYAARGHILYTLDRWVEAEEAFTEAEAQGINDAFFWETRGINAAKLNRRQDAIGWFDRAILLDSKRAGAWSHKALGLLSLGELQESLEASTQSLAIDRTECMAWAAHATALLLTKQWSKALSAIENVITLNAEIDIVFYSETSHTQGTKGMILYVLGRSAEAVDVFTRVLAYAPNDSMSMNCRGVANADLGNDEAAFADLAKAVELNPKSLNLENLAAITARRSHWEEAFDLLRRRFQDYPINLAAWRSQFPGVSFIRAVLTSTTIRVTWKERLEKLIAICSEANALTYLGTELVKSLWRFPPELLTGDLIAGWIELWRELTREHAELELPLRLYEVGIRYLQTQDEKVFLDLLQEERKILQDALGVKSSDDE